jgi:hypothetical protein
MQDSVTVNALFAFIDDWKPEIRVHMGDNWDFRNLRKGASDDEKAASMKDDWEYGTEFLRKFFAGGKIKAFLRGNHDERIWDLTKSSRGLKRDYAFQGVQRIEQLVTKLHAEMFPYDSALGIFKLGHLNTLHGYHSGIGACRQHAAIYGNCLIGHVHTIESSPVSALEPAEARSIGCLCIRDMDYLNKKTGKLRHAQGWAYGLLFPDGHYQLFQTRKLNDRFYASTSITEY